MSMPSSERLDAELLALAGLVGDLGGVQQRLGRDAARSAGRCRRPCPSRSGRPTGPARRRAARRRSRRSTAEDHQVGVVLRHVDISLDASSGPRLTAARVVAAHPVTSATMRAGARSHREKTGHQRTLSPTASSRTTRRAAWGCGRGCAGATGRGRRGRSTADDEAHLRAWAAAHDAASRRSSSRGPRSPDHTIVLVADDGEWTRRRIDGPDAARKLARSMRIPVYDVQSSATRSGCATTTPASGSCATASAAATSAPDADRQASGRIMRRSSGDESASQRLDRASRVRTGTPVPPLGV